jgi:NO-binding membrane sensor protein with MHYT domain
MRMLKQWINAILGLGVIAMPFMGMTAITTMWTLVIAGIVITVLSMWSVYEYTEDAREVQTFREIHI